MQCRCAVGCQGEALHLGSDLATFDRWGLAFNSQLHGHDKKAQHASKQLRSA